MFAAVCEKQLPQVCAFPAVGPLTEALAVLLYCCAVLLHDDNMLSVQCLAKAAPAKEHCQYTGPGDLLLISTLRMRPIVRCMSPTSRHAHQEQQYAVHQAMNGIVNLVFEALRLTTCAEANKLAATQHTASLLSSTRFTFTSCHSSPDIALRQKPHA